MECCSRLRNREVDYRKLQSHVYLNSIMVTPTKGIHNWSGSGSRKQLVRQTLHYWQILWHREGIKNDGWKNFPTSAWPSLPSKVCMIWSSYTCQMAPLERFQVWIPLQTMTEALKGNPSIKLKKNDSVLNWYLWTGSKKKIEQAVAELCQAQGKLKLVWLWLYPCLLWFTRMIWICQFVSWIWFWCFDFVALKYLVWYI